MHNLEGQPTFVGRVGGVFQKVLGLNQRAVSGLILKAVGSGLSFIFIKAVAKVSGAEGMGIFSICFTLALFLSTLGRLGLDVALLKQSAAATALGNYNRLGQGIVKGGGAIFISTLILALALWFSAPLIGDMLLHKPHMEGYLRVAGLWMIPWALLFFTTETLRGMGKLQAYQFLQGALPFAVALGIMIPALSGALPFVEVDLPMLAYWAGLGISFFAAAIVIMVAMKKPGFTTPNSGRHFPFGTLWRTARPAWYAALLAVVLGWADTFMLGIWWPAEEAGVYAIALRLSNLVIMPLLALGGVFAPAFAGYFARKEVGSLQTILKNSSKSIFKVTLPLYLVLAIGSPWIMRFFGASFAEGWYLLVILATGQLYNCFCGAKDLALQMTGNEKYHRNFIALAVVVNLLLNFILIPVFGATGAAIANVAANALWNTLAVFKVRKEFGVWMFGF